MTSKNTFATIGILAVLLMGLGMVSAIELTVIEGLPSPVNLGQTYTVTFDLDNTDTTVDNFTLSWDLDSAIEVSGLPSLIENGTALSLSADITILSNTMSDISYNLELTAINDSDNTETILSHSFTSEISFCSYGDDFSGENKTSLEIKNFEIINLGVGDYSEWELLDEIEIEVEIKNTDNDNNVNDVMVEVMILNDNDEDVTSDFDLDEDKIDLGRVRDGESEFAIFKIKEVPANLDGTYKLYFRAYSDGDELSHCVSSTSDFDQDNYQEIEVITLGDAAVVVSPEYVEALASCGEDNVEVTLDVYNLGEDKEEKILVNLYNSVLGIDEKIVITNLRSGKRREITFIFDVPEELDKSYYDLHVLTYYDYDNDEDELNIFSYGESSYDDLDKDFVIRLELLSCKGPAPTVSANLESIAEIGQELVIKSIITNNGKDNDFVFSLSDYESWANLVSISTQSASINEGEYSEVTITLAPTVAGTHSFNINTIVDGESYDQPVSVNITEKPTVFTKINDAMGDNAVLYISMGIAGLLILIVSVLIVKVSRKKVSPQF